MVQERMSRAEYRLFRMAMQLEVEGFTFEEIASAAEAVERSYRS